MKLASHPLTFPELLFILLMLLVPSLMDPKLSNLAANLLQGSISRTFYEKLLFLQIRKRKNSVKLSVSFYAFGICARKSFAKNVDEIDTRYQKAQNTVKLSVFFTLLGSAFVKALHKMLVKWIPRSLSASFFNKFYNMLDYSSLEFLFLLHTFAIDGKIKRPYML